MNRLRKGIFFAVLFILFEASIRKYIFSSPLIILVKYIFLAPLFFFAFKSTSARYSIFLFFITLPLLATIPSPSFIPYAVYDLVNIFYLPVLLFSLSLSKHLFSARSARKPLILIAIIGFLNSFLIILQSLVGPRHWLSQTVDQAFTVHAWGEAFKAPGLAGSASPYISIAGLIAVDVLSNSPISKRVKGILLFAQLLILISSIFNLTSRSYAIGIVAFLLARFLISSLVYKRFDIASFMIILLPFVYSLLQSIAPDWGLNIFLANRTVDDFGSAAPRLFDIPVLDLISLFANNPLDIPFLDGVGLGYAVNNNPFADIYYTPPFCSEIGLGLEQEYERLFCSFGSISFLHILSRLVLAAICLRNALTSLKLRLPATISSGWFLFFVAMTNAASLRANDTATGLLLILIALSASQSLMSQRFSECPPNLYLPDSL